MRGYTTNIVNLIADNLRDRYQTGPQIIKELIQNADDAKDPHAKRFEFGKHPGFPDSNNPLFKGPALYFFNDGGFSKKDERAIYSFAENSKAGEDDVIGKYGLGMKSVFHLCEAFFYIAFNGHEKFKEGINPWKQNDSNLHPEWDEIYEQDWTGLENVAKELTGRESLTWFLLWLPLRSKGHLITRDGQETGYITNRFPGDSKTHELEFLSNKDLSTQLATFLPILQHLETISYYPSKVRNLDGGFRIKLNTQRRINHKAPKSISLGNVQIQPQMKSLEFTAQQQKSNSEFFVSLKKSQHWPETYYRDSLGKLNQKKYEATPEASVMIQHIDQQDGQLNIRWAVFLPLEDDDHTYHARINGSNRNYNITLHGQFFMDAGRRGIYGFDSLYQTSSQNFDLESLQDEAQLRKHWNRSLIEEVVLGLLIPAMESYGNSVKAQGRVHICQELTEAILNASISKNNAKFFDRFRDKVCKDYVWVKVLSKDKNANYISVPRESTLRPLPTVPQSNSGIPWETFRNLSNFDTSHIFFDGHSPALTLSRTKWSDEEIIKLFDFELSDVKRVFTNRSLISYLVSFLDSYFIPSKNSHAFQIKLIQLMKLCFKEIEHQALSPNRSYIKRIINLIEPSKRIKISSSLPSDVYMDLWKQELDFLPVPSDMEPEDKSSRILIGEEVLSCLLTLSPHIKRYEQNNQHNEMSETLKLAQELLKSLNAEERLNLLSMHPNLYIMVVRDPRLRKDVAVSVSELNSVNQSGYLFVFSGGLGDETMGLTPLLAKVLPEERILLVRAQIYREIFANSEDLPRSDNGLACLKALGNQAKPLGPLLVREELLDKINASGQDPEARRGLRYVLHGSFDNFFNETENLWIPAHQQSDAWEKLWRQTTGIGDHGEWNVIERRLSKTLPQKRWDILGIKEINVDNVLNRIKSNQEIVIDPASFTESDSIEILTAIDDPTLWKRLPLHVTVDEGKLTSIDENTYLESDEPLEDGLESTIKIIQKSENPVLAKQQSKWLKTLTVQARIQIALKTDDPSRYWKTIIEAFGDIQKLSDPFIETLCGVPWLPRINGDPVSPNSVIDLPGLADDLERITERKDIGFFNPRQLLQDIRNHSNYERLRKQALASGSRGFENLAILLEKTPKFYIGEIPQLDFKHFKVLLPYLFKITTLPGWHLLKKTIESSDDEENCYKLLLNALRKPIEPEKTVSILLSLAQTGENQSSIRQIFNLYLKAFAADQSFAKSNLHRLKLLSRAGNWQLAEDLCTGVIGLYEDSVLDAEQSRILYNIAETGQHNTKRVGITNISIADFEHHLEAAAKIAKDFFHEWSGLIPDNLIGGLLALFGGHPEMRDLAEHYLAPRSFDWFVNMIEWNDPERWLKNHSARDALDKTRFVLKTADPDGIYTLSLIGEKLRVKLSKTFDSLIVGEIGGRGYDVILSLRKIDPVERTTDELSDLLKRSAEYLLRKLYEQSHLDLEYLWQTLDNVNQIQTDVAHRLILEHLPFYLRMLSLHRRHPGLAAAMKHYFNVHTRLIEAEQIGRNDTTAERKNIRNALNKIAEILENDKEAQQIVLEAYRGKVKDFQYSPESIPFELFQNADDATLEQGQINAYHLEDIEIPSVLQRFVIHQSDLTLRFIHWGRPINSRGPVGFDGEGRGFHHDLENMLILASSDKALGDRGTGKFGLGFKSVFLACDRPKIISGRLRIEIIAGILPQFWKNPTESIKHLEKETIDRTKPGTLIELSDITENNILERFRKLSGILCVFGRAIKEIQLKPNGDPTNVRWNPQQLVSQVEIGHLAVFTKEWGPDTLALHFRLSDSDGNVLLALGPHGFRRLPDDVPSLWVTAPTRDQLNVGFAINADFDIDVGRAQLATDSERNVEIIKNLGASLGKDLCEFYDFSTRDWDHFCNELHLVTGLPKYSFWESLWQLFGNDISRRIEGGNSNSIGLVRELLWSNKNHGMYCLVSDRKALPTGLWGKYRVLTQIDDIKYSVKGALDNESVFSKASELLEFQNRVNPGQVISYSSIGENLRKFGRTILFKQIDFQLVIEWEMGAAPEIGPIRARLYGKLINEEFLRDLGIRSESIRKEKESISNILSSLKFLGKDDEYYNPQKLLVGDDLKSGHVDEARRTGFAPLNRILSPDYDEVGISFFRACRDRLDAGPEELAVWVLAATSDQEKINALRYLLNGDLRLPLAKELIRCLKNSWLMDLESLSLFKQFDHHERMQLIGLLHLQSRNYGEGQARWSESFVPISNPRDLLESIYEWWGNNRNIYLRKYENQTYPEACAVIPEIDGIQNNISVRKTWLMLFILGAAHTIPRTKPEQHRNYLKICDEEGWLDIFSQPLENYEVWVRKLVNYFDRAIEEIKFYYWIRQLFVPIIQLTKWLPEYVDSFLDINRYPNDFLLTSILRSRTNAMLQGGGSEAPPITSALGIGANFIVRELARHQIINNRYSYPHCYVPVLSVRKLMEKLGCRNIYEHKNNKWGTSPLIYKHLANNLDSERAIFSGDFDIPLFLISRDNDLQEKFLNEILPEDDEQTDEESL